MKKAGLIFTFLFLAIFVCCNPIFANKDKMPGSIQSNDSTSLNEATAYRMLYDNQVKSNDAILKTIFYALGGLATAIALVFASNWWFNEKKVIDIRNGINAQINEARNEAINEVEMRINSLANEKTTQLNDLQNKLQGQISAVINEVEMRTSSFATEKTTQLNDLQNKLQEHISTSIADITLRANEFHEKIRAEIKEDNKTLLGNYQTQLEAFNVNYRQQISILNENINNQTDIIKKQINSIENNLKTEISSLTNDLKQQIARNEYYMWRQGGIMGNALSAQIEELALLLEESSEYTNYEFYLSSITDTLEGVSKIYPSEKEKIISIIKKVPKKYESLKIALLKKLETIKTEEL